MSHKAGFVSIIGYPNVGKSTLMNALVGERLSIITPKAQTTRHRIKGIVNGPDYQVVYSDTPGILKPNYKLHHSMMDAVLSSLLDADIILLITEKKLQFSETEILDHIKTASIPVIVAINKIDLSNQDEVAQEVTKWEEILPGAIVIPVSGLYNANIDMLQNTVLRLIPESPPFFSKDDLTDSTERFFVAEIIREKILLNFSEEIPYSSAVTVNSFKEKKKGDQPLIYIEATIFVERESQKAIILGHHGSAIKKLGTDARKEIEALCMTGIQ